MSGSVAKRKGHIRVIELEKIIAVEIALEKF